MNSRFAPPGQGDAQSGATQPGTSRSTLRIPKAAVKELKLRYLPVRASRGWSRVFWGVASIAVGAFFLGATAWGLINHDGRFFDEWGFGLLFFSPLVVWGLVYAPSNLKWGLANPPVELGPLGITYADPPHWHPTLVPWETFRGGETVHASNKEQISQVVGLRVQSGAPYGYGLAVEPGGLRVRRPNRAARMAAGPLQIPLTNDPEDLAGATKAISDYYQEWQKLPEDARTQVVTRNNRAGVPTEDPLAWIVFELTPSQAQPIVLGASRIVLRGTRRPNLWGLLWSLLGAAFCALVSLGSVPEPGFGWDGESAALCVAFAAGVIACLWAAGYNLARLCIPFPLVLDAEEITIRTRLLGGPEVFRWGQVESVRADGKTWRLRTKADPKAPVRGQTLRAYRHLTAEQVGILVNAYHLAWLEEAAACVSCIV